MSRIEYSWQVALQQSLLPLPRSTQVTRVSMFDLSAIHRPVLAFSGTVIREFRFPIHPTVCFKVGRFTLTQSSWTAPNQRCSRKWMSGHAVIALVLIRDRGQLATLTICRLGEPLPPSQRESPFPVDFYLSWMSPVSHRARGGRVGLYRCNPCAKGVYCENWNHI